MTFREAVVIGKIMCEHGCGDYNIGVDIGYDLGTPDNYPFQIDDYWNNTIEMYDTLFSGNNEFRKIGKEIEKALQDANITNRGMKTNW